MQNKRDEYTINFGEKRFVEDYPKVGVRSTIDGRYGGVRESLEE
ncbi:L-fucose isomerase 1 domain protein [Caldicellulosiruptor kronotskyensis 2002]|uniref:L-fucose isomerase 1 domain protein n=2 Tax=Caldicellulosiruptor TaxID=44000 RepID=E4SEH6_CALK2|nr:L-fucose isomerase 1 domain protein [Caldicellulosiruptor kronotskyensis 2002]